MVKYADLMPKTLINTTIESLKTLGPQGYGHLADVYYQLGNYKEALDYLDRTIAIEEARSKGGENGYLLGLKSKREKYAYALEGNQ